MVSITSTTGTSSNFARAALLSLPFTSMPSYNPLLPSMTAMSVPLLREENSALISSSVEV